MLLPTRLLGSRRYLAELRRNFRRAPRDLFPAWSLESVVPAKWGGFQRTNHVLNKAQIIGRLGQDPQTVSDGVVRLNVATTETWKDRESGERREKTEWHQVSLFGKLAEVATNYLRKGSLVYIEGSLETRKYDKDGVTHYSTSIKGRELRMLEKRGEGAEEGAGAGEGARGNARDGGQRGNGQRSNGQGSNGGSNGTRAAASSSAPAGDADFEDLDIPF